LVRGYLEGTGEIVILLALRSLKVAGAMAQAKLAAHLLAMAAVMVAMGAQLEITHTVVAEEEALVATLVMGVLVGAMTHRRAAVTAPPDPEVVVGEVVIQVAEQAAVLEFSGRVQAEE
jgi:hypothetical protein